MTFNLNENTNIPISHATDAVGKVLGQKGAVNFLAKLKPGIQKHTSWNEINSALIDQGAQPAHIAKVAGHLKPTQYDEGKQMKTFRQFKEDYQIESLPHSYARSMQADVVAGKRQRAAAANPENTNLAQKAVASKELAQKKRETYGSALDKHRAQFAPADAETERNIRGYGQNRNMGD